MMAYGGVLLSALAGLGTERLEKANEICYMGLWVYRETNDSLAGRNAENRCNRGG